MTVEREPFPVDGYRGTSFVDVIVIVIVIVSLLPQCAIGPFAGQFA